MLAADRVDDLLRAAADHFVGEDRQRLLAALPWRPASRVRGEVEGVEHAAPESAVEYGGIDGLAARPHEHDNSYCFALLLEEDDVLRAAAYPGSEEGGPRRHVRVGCVWVSLRAGERLAVLRATAATSTMSRDFEASPNIKAAFVHWAKAGGAKALFLDTERPDGTWRMLHPAERAVPKPAEEHLIAAEAGPGVHVSADALCAEALRLAGLPGDP